MGWSSKLVLLSNIKKWHLTSGRKLGRWATPDLRLFDAWKKFQTYSSQMVVKNGDLPWYKVKKSPTKQIQVFLIVQIEKIPPTCLVWSRWCFPMSNGPPFHVGRLSGAAVESSPNIVLLETQLDAFHHGITEGFELPLRRRIYRKLHRFLLFFNIDIWKIYIYASCIRILFVKLIQAPLSR